MNPCTELKRVQAELDSFQFRSDDISWIGQPKLDAGMKILLVDEGDFSSPSNWFFLGDIHGDFFALVTCVEHIKAQCEDFRLVFLGDMVDRGPHSAECFLYFIELARKYPVRIAWIMGNHDAGIYRLPSGEFHSSVSPSEFIEVLNSSQPVEGKIHIGDFFLKVVSGLPRAMILPNGLLVTHGGFPHSDLQQKAKPLSSLAEQYAWAGSDRCLQDFTWTRISRFPKKMPNRVTSGCSYGFLDFKGFVESVSGVARLRALLTGHEHPLEGFDRHDTWQEYPALTLTGFGFGQDYLEESAYKGNYRKKLVVARMGSETILPEIACIQVDAELLEKYFEIFLSIRFGSKVLETPAPQITGNEN